MDKSIKKENQEAIDIQKKILLWIFGVIFVVVVILAIIKFAIF